MKKEKGLVATLLECGLCHSFNKSFSTGVGENLGTDPQKVGSMYLSFFSVFQFNIYFLPIFYIKLLSFKFLLR